MFYLTPLGEFIAKEFYGEEMCVFSSSSSPFFFFILERLGDR